MVRLILLLLGTPYLRRRWRSLMVMGVVWLIAGVGLVFDALDGPLVFPLKFFAWLFVVEGAVTLLAASVGSGGQKKLRYVKAVAVLAAAALILTRTHEGNFIFSLLFGSLFLVDGLLQCMAAWVVRFRRWRFVVTAGVMEILVAIFFFQPYPTHYVGTIPYALGLFLAFGGLRLLTLAIRVRSLLRNPAFGADHDESEHAPPADAVPARRRQPVEWDGPPTDAEHALTVHVWTPAGSSKSQPLNRPLVGRYIAAVDINGVISTGHAALESPEGIYVSLYPGIEIDRSPEEFASTLRATPENDIPGVFQPDYPTESVTWCPSTVRVRIRNYDPAKLASFWKIYRADNHYNLTSRNCSSSVSRALEAALDGSVGAARGSGWAAFLWLVTTPEFWIAAQIRKRAVTMAWTPGLTLDYARALSMLADPRPMGLVKWLRLRRP